MMKMKFLNIVFVSAAMAAAASCAKVSPVTDAPAATSPEETVPAYMPGEVVLKFDEPRRQSLHTCRGKSC